MTEDLRPAPRLPLDIAEYTAIKEGSLDGFITRDPDTGPHQISLLQTRTPLYWPSAWDRAVYDKSLNYYFDTQQEAEDVARPVLREFDKDSPRPPQFPGIST